MCVGGEEGGALNTGGEREGLGGLHGLQEIEYDS